MGIVNVTRDSFSGDGQAHDHAAALAHAHRLLEEGADLLDIGGESSRPGAEPVSERDELARVVPLVAELRGCGVPLSVDTVKPRVMAEALAAGADLINDINALRSPGALEAVLPTNAAICLMHMQGTPSTMQQAPFYADVVSEVSDFLAQRVNVLLTAGVAPERICLDPGFGFGKQLQHNISLFQGINQLHDLNFPLLIGVSRKSMLGQITGREVGDRMPASIAAALLAAQQGAQIIRVHDVAATKDALAVLSALNGGKLN